MFTLRKLLLLMALVTITTACSDAQQNRQIVPVEIDQEAFKEYWYAGKAELNHFELQEIRYGQIRDGYSVMIFVTEDFLTNQQVKLESSPAGRPYANVLKLNRMEEFTTGLYEYNMMASVFTPVNYQQYPNTQKVTISAQDWCGQAFMQLNEEPNAYRVQGYSYFEAEGDFEKQLEKVWLEDEIWTKLRLSPELLPEGEITIIPGGFYQRFSHREWATANAEASKRSFANEEGTFPGETLMAYQLTYTNLDRTLTIVYEQEFPHRIAGWIKKTNGRDGEPLTATSVRTKTMISPYWSKNQNRHEILRDSLGISR